MEPGVCVLRLNLCEDLLLVKADTMQTKKLSRLISILLVSVFVLANCGPVTSVPIVTETVEVHPDLNVQVHTVGPAIVGQTPPGGSTAGAFIVHRI